jgi:hypothetical protein
MDSTGARHLAARLRAGVRVGTVIELVLDLPGDSGLQAGDRGVVCHIAATGNVVVAWDRGFDLEIDPVQTAFRPLAA